jgi:hypothetical protein
MFSTLFILTALVAAKKTAPQPGEGLGYVPTAETTPSLQNATLGSRVRLAA